MEQLNAWVTTIIGILMVLSMFVKGMGNLTTGFTGWVVSILVLLMGIIALTKKD